MSRVWLFFGYAIAGFSFTTVTHAVLKATSLTIYGKNGPVFGALFRMHLYHEQHAYQYLLLVALVYGAMASLWACYLGKTQKGWTRRASILGVMALTIICSSIPGGMLWVIHGVQAGYFPGVEQFLKNLWWGASTGLSVGWLIFMLSIPYNLLCLIGGYWLTDYIEKAIRQRNLMNE